MRSPNDKNTRIIPIKSEWFDMILSGIKKEEYRALKAYWTSRFFYKSMKAKTDVIKYLKLRNGYNGSTSREITIKLLDIIIAKPKKEWCPRDTNLKDLFIVLKLGRIVAVRNLGYEFRPLSDEQLRSRAMRDDHTFNYDY